MGGERRLGPRLAEVVQLHRDCGPMLVAAGGAVAVLGGILERSIGLLIFELVAALLICLLFSRLFRRQVGRQLTSSIEGRRSLPIDARRATRERTRLHAVAYAGSIGAASALLVVLFFVLAESGSFSGLMGGMVMAMGLASRRLAEAAEEWERSEGARLWFEPDTSFIFVKPTRKVRLYAEPVAAPAAHG